MFFKVTHERHFELPPADKKKSSAVVRGRRNRRPTLFFGSTRKGALAGMADWTSDVFVVEAGQGYKLADWQADRDRFTRAKTEDDPLSPRKWDNIDMKGTRRVEIAEITESRGKRRRRSMCAPPPRKRRHGGWIVRLLRAIIA